MSGIWERLEENARLKKKIKQLERRLIAAQIDKKELWARIPGHKGFYISSFGRVYNSTSGKFLNGTLHKSRSGVYRRVAMEKTRYMVHCLVADAFIVRPADPIERLIVDHLDGNTLNNNASNLEWVTQSENVKRWHLLRRSPEKAGL